MLKVACLVVLVNEVKIVDLVLVVKAVKLRGWWLWSMREKT